MGFLFSIFVTIFGQLSGPVSREIEVVSCLGSEGMIYDFAMQMS